MVAPVKKCPSCKNIMQSDEQKFEPKGYWCVWTCWNDNCPYYKNGHRYAVKDFVGAKY